MRAKLYWFGVSHPAQAVRVMLALKGVEYDSVNVLPGMQRVQLRLHGFRGGTVPALKLDGRRVQGSRPIARALEELVPEPSLYPPDPQLRARADEAERWGDEELQDVPRRIFRWGVIRDLELRRWLARQSQIPAPELAARLSGMNARYYARAVRATTEAVRRELAELPATLARVDALLADGTLTLEPPSAAALQVLCSVRALEGFSDLHDQVAAHPCAAAARRLIPEYPGPVPRFLPAEWL